MTNKAKEFARLVASGVKPVEAYKSAYNRPDIDNISASKHASRLMKKDEIAARIAKVDEVMDRAAMMGKQERMEWLSEQVRAVKPGLSEPQEVANAIRCVAELNKMDGAYEPERVEAKVETRSFAAVMAAVSGRVSASAE